MTMTFRKPADFFAMAGQPLGASEWITVEQDRIDLFADATGDHQWIHVDPERAKSGPFGACIAHGYLSLSLVNLFLPQVVGVENLKMGVNYGCDRIRFPAPVPVGARIRGVCELLRAEPMDGNGVQATVRVTVEIEGSTKPGCVADTISRYFFA
ncbi:MaoC family dehydratase [Undibacterium arcticum]|uniref:MaoC family dehydratase n=1 Tax=Undibacterium arcticum TaxID=1762892 RepID=A0ABV7EYK8_9BURK